MKKTGGNYKWYALGMLWVVSFLNYLDRNVIFAVFPLLQEQFHLTRTQLAYLGSGFLAVYALSVPVLGYVADRWVRKYIIIIGLSVWSLVTAFTGMAQSFVQLVIFRGLTGLGEGSYYPPATSLISDFFKKKERGRALALHGTALFIGGALGYAMGGFLGEKFGWRTPFFIAAIPGLLWAVFLWFNLREPVKGSGDVESESTTIQVDQKKISYLSMLKTPTLVLLCLCFACSNFAVWGLNTWTPTYFKEVRHFSLTMAGLLTALPAIAAALGQIVGGILSDRLMGKVRFIRTLIIAVGFFLSIPCIIGFIALPSATLALICLFGVWFFRSMADPNFYAVLLETILPEARSAATGFMTFAGFVGATLAPYVLARIAEAPAGLGGALMTLSVFLGAVGLFSSIMCVVTPRDMGKIEQEMSVRIK